MIDTKHTGQENSISQSNEIEEQNYFMVVIILIVLLGAGCLVLYFRHQNSMDGLIHQMQNIISESKNVVLSSNSKKFDKLHKKVNEYLKHIQNEQGVNQFNELDPKLRKKIITDDLYIFQREILSITMRNIDNPKNINEYYANLSEALLKCNKLIQLRQSSISLLSKNFKDTLNKTLNVVELHYNNKKTSNEKIVQSLQHAVELCPQLKNIRDLINQTV